MRFFIEFLNNFTAVELLKMFAEGAFRTTDEIKMADYTINYKVIFDDNEIPSEEMKIYKHLQSVVEVIRVQYKFYITNLEETFRYYSTEEVPFKYFINFGENEREVMRLNIVERRMIFAFRAKDEHFSVFTWLKHALNELLTYVLREFEETDRVGIVIKHENQQDRKATFPIRLKNELEASIIIDTLNSIVRLRSSFIAEDRMMLQVLRIRLPVFYRKLTHHGVPPSGNNDSFSFIEGINI